MAATVLPLPPTQGLDPVSSGLGGLLHQLAFEAVGLWFGQLVHFVAEADLSTISRLWTIVSSSTEPVLDGPVWHAEFSTMTVIGAMVALPLLCVATIQAVARQDAGGLARTAFIRLPLALLFTGVAVELVSLGLQATDQACAALIRSAGRPLSSLFSQMTLVLGGTNLTSLSVNFIYLLLAGFLAFVVWIELAVRSAAVALATLFLPLALAGSALPATAHWAKRLGETLTALVLSKLAIVAALTLAVGALGGASGGMASVLEGITLLGLAAVAPLGLARLLPMVELGAISHLDGVARHSLRTVANAAGSPHDWMTSSGGPMMAGPDWFPQSSSTSGPDGKSGGSGRGSASPFGGVEARAPTETDGAPMTAPPPARPVRTAGGDSLGGSHRPRDDNAYDSGGSQQSRD